MAPRTRGAAVPVGDPDHSFSFLTPELKLFILPKYSIPLA
jgi:hypothetical protein